MRSISLSMLTALATLVVAPDLMSQTTFHIAQAPVGLGQAPRVQLNLPPPELGHLPRSTDGRHG